MPGMARRHRRIAANTLRSKSSCHISSVTLSKAIAREVPALLTSTSTLPRPSAAALNTSAHAAAVLTSAEIVITLAAPPAAAMMAARASSSSFGRRATMATPAPALAKLVAMASPMPLLAPVTSAARPVIRMSIMSVS